MKNITLLIGLFIGASLLAQDGRELIWDSRNMIGVPAPGSLDDWTFVPEDDKRSLNFKFVGSTDCDADISFSVWLGFGRGETKEESINKIGSGYRNYIKQSTEKIVIDGQQGISQQGTFDSNNGGEKVMSVISMFGYEDKPIIIMFKAPKNENCSNVVLESYKELLKRVKFKGIESPLSKLKKKVEEDYQDNGVFAYDYKNSQDSKNLILLADQKPDWALKKRVGFVIYQLYKQHNNKEAAKKWLTKQADYGDADAQFWLGMEYGNWDGYGNSNYRTMELPVNMDLHKSYLEKAYINDNKRASGLLIRTYEKEKDYKNLIKWLKLDILQGETGARRSNYELYKIYFEGEKAPKDFDKANSYLRKAVKANDSYAMFLYGVKLYEGKEGINQNKSKGLEYLKKASNWRDCNAYNYLVSMGIYVEDKGDCDQ